MIFTMNSGYFLKHPQLTDLCNENTVIFLQSRIWNFTYCIMDIWRYFHSSNYSKYYLLLCDAL